MDGTLKFAIGCWGAVVAFWIVSAFAVKRTTAKEPLRDRLIYVVVVALAAVLLNGSERLFAWDHAVLPHTVPLGILSDFIVLIGLLVAVWARVTLGQNWSARVSLKENHELVERGPYRIVRHPIYSGLLLMILGTAVLIGRVGGFVAFLICCYGFWVKARREERMLAEHLAGYSEYMRRSKALVPFVW